MVKFDSNHLKGCGRISYNHYRMIPFSLVYRDIKGAVDDNLLFEDLKPSNVRLFQADLMTEYVCIQNHLSLKCSFFLRETSLSHVSFL